MCYMRGLGSILDVPSHKPVETVVKKEDIARIRTHKLVTDTVPANTKHRA